MDETVLLMMLFIGVSFMIHYNTPQQHTYTTPDVFTQTCHVDPVLHNFRNKSIFIVGTSFARVLYFDMFRIGLCRDPTVTERFVPSYEGVVLSEHCQDAAEVFEGRYCFKKTGVSCNLPGPAGVDLRRCGIPHNKTMHIASHNITVHFQFKTYLFTKEHDQMIARDMKEYDYYILGSAEWGLNRYINNTDYHYQAKMYYDTILPATANKTKVFVYNDGYNRSTKAQFDYLKHQHGVRIFNTKPLVSRGKSQGVPSGHGYEGKISISILRGVLKQIKNG